MRRRSALSAVLALVAAAASAQEDFSGAEVTSQRLTDDLTVLVGAGGGIVAGNVLVFTGDDGVVIVDTGYAEMLAKYEAAIAAVGGGSVRIAIDTHWHGDHSDGNKAFGATGAVLVAHERSREPLTRHARINVVRTVLEQPAYPPAGLPTVTYTDGMRIHFNGDDLELLHVAPAHTAGDTAVFLEGHNVVHTGDLFIVHGYPFVDFDNGGSLDGLIAFCRTILDRIDADTVIVPGHGAIARYQDLADFIAMLTTVRRRIAELVANGATLEQVVAARPTAEFDAKYGNPAQFLNRAYASLSALR